jgi:hypothetical protein
VHDLAGRDREVDAGLVRVLVRLHRLEALALAPVVDRVRDTLDQVRAALVERALEHLGVQ